ncbi:GTP cyclohydrolase 1 type 2/Nif3 [Papiliotrema laurentii]|uniref:GTP cyclohydrolase 1 type 2/Nif3 n=1 Tax=Papiliotrema laurentii TaxID=5418 RepID=A0AAD9L9J9_PAPLA|nr:GTP cyclohydrolase 1 type 2/Nif3 [Papiliotrema laurentii]
MSVKLPVSPIQHVKRVWEKIAPLALADHSWDNVGIMIESPVPNQQHKQVLLTIDLTTAVCNEALALPSCSVVVSYHPPIFRGLKSMTLSDPLQASLLKLAARGISVFSPHTSLDATPKGINTWLVEPFKPYASSSLPIVPSEGAEVEGAGMGKIVQLKEKLSVSQIVSMVKQHLSLEFVQLSVPDEERPIESIAVCAGSGGSMFKGVKADLLFTGEMSHHEVLAAKAAGTAVILANHTNTERPYLTKVLQGWLQKELNDAEEGAEGNWEVVVSQTDADPLRTV